MTQEIQDARLEALILEALDEHGRGREALIPVLCHLNRELGYIPAAAFGIIRRRLNEPAEGLFLADSHLYAVASFYQMFSLQPTGRHVIRYCESAPCHVVGARRVLETLQEELGIAPGETSRDGQWTLLPTSCIGVCSVGPVFLVDDDLYGNVTPERVHGILEHYRYALPEVLA